MKGFQPRAPEQGPVLSSSNAQLNERLAEPLDFGSNEFAREGVSGAGDALPYLDAIQSSFGSHDVSQVQAHVGGNARHANEAIGSEAYATGSSVAFASQPDLHTAAHEAAHTVQQQGGATGPQGLGAADDPFENHADKVADAVVAGESAQELLDQSAPSGVSAAAPAGQSVQRIMSVDAFKVATSGKWRRRSRVTTEIQPRLVDYNGTSHGTDLMVEKRTKLMALRTSVLAYINDKPDGDRTDGVNTLRDEIAAEMPHVEKFAEAAEALGRGDGGAAFKLALEAKDFLLAFQCGGRELGSPPNDADLMGRAQRAMPTEGEGSRDSVMKEIIEADLAMLKALAESDDVDTDLKKAIEFALANKDQIYFQETKGQASGAVLATDKDREKGIDKKFRVDMQMIQKEGLWERLSSLLHEMTHCAVQEEFGNTAMHLAMPTDTSKEDAIALAQHREARLDELDALLPELEGVLSGPQIGVFREKIDYPVKGKNTLTSYAGLMKRKGEMSQEKHDEIVDLDNSGANNSLTEFDTVIAQMFLMAVQWGVPSDNAFLAKLKAVQAETYSYRENA